MGKREDVRCRSNNTDSNTWLSRGKLIIQSCHCENEGNETFLPEVVVKSENMGEGCSTNGVSEPVKSKYYS